jgi:hypothetical protein
MASHSWKVLAAGGLIGASLLVGPVFAEAGSVLKFPQDITFKDTAAGVQVAVLYGDPAKSGLYVVRLKLLAGSRVVPHTRRCAHAHRSLRNALLRTRRQMG